MQDNVDFKPDITQKVQDELKKSGKEPLPFEPEEMEQLTGIHSDHDL